MHLSQRPFLIFYVGAIQPFLLLLRGRCSAGIEPSLPGGQVSSILSPSSLSRTCPHWAAYQKSWPDHYCCSPTRCCPSRRGRTRSWQRGNARAEQGKESPREQEVIFRAHLHFSPSSLHVTLEDHGQCSCMVHNLVLPPACLQMLWPLS